MKKLLVLALVLSMATLANAGFSPSVSATLSGSNNPGSGSVSLYVVPNATDQADDYMAVTLVGPGTITAVLGPQIPTDTVDVGSAVSNSLDGLIGEGEIWGITSYSSTYPTGVWITATYTGAVAGDKIQAWESIDASFTDLQPNLRSQIVITPEPITVALLGLGGLFLRRRK